MNCSHHFEHQCPAVGSQRIAKARSARKLIGFLEVLVQQPSSIDGRYFQAIDPDVLAPDVAAQPNQATLIGSHDRQLVLLKEAGDRRIALIAQRFTCAALLPNGNRAPDANQ
jgi:hypothetical protein